MSDQRLSFLRLMSLIFLLPGLAGLIISAAISTQYLENLPRNPVPAELRMTPRNIHGTIVYQTEEEDRRLNVLEYSSVAIFVVGLGLGFVYLRKWGLTAALNAEDEDQLTDRA